MQILLEAARGNLIGLEKALSDGEHINSRDKDYYTALHWACNKGHLEVVKFLLAHGAEIGARNVLGWTPFHVACAKGHKNIIFVLLGHGAAPKLILKGDQIALHIAAAHGKEEVFQLLWQYTDWKGFGLTELMHAIINNDTGIVGDLAIASDPIAQDIGGWAAMHWASKLGTELSIVNFIIEETLSQAGHLELKNKEGATPLHIACCNGYSQVVDQLLIIGADITAKLAGDLTSLHLACREGHYIIVDKLLEKISANQTLINARDKDGRTPLHYACENGHAPVVGRLIEIGAGLTNVDYEGNTPLHLACENGYGKVAMGLLYSGAELNIKNKNNQTPAQLALIYGHLQLIEELTQNRVDA